MSRCLTHGSLEEMSSASSYFPSSLDVTGCCLRVKKKLYIFIFHSHPLIQVLTPSPRSRARDRCAPYSGGYVSFDKGSDIVCLNESKKYGVAMFPEQAQGDEVAEISEQLAKESAKKKKKNTQKAQGGADAAVKREVE